MGTLRNMLRLATGRMSEAEKAYRNWCTEAADERVGRFYLADHPADKEYERGRHALMATQVPSARASQRILQDVVAPAQEHAADFQRGYQDQKTEVARRRRAAGIADDDSM